MVCGSVKSLIETPMKKILSVNLNSDRQLNPTDDDTTLNLYIHYLRFVKPSFKIVIYVFINFFSIYLF